ncbi:hypothetical protein H7170_03885 [Candidatus Gracilibacteria bacterium]|nr:hypothetical protein [Candidatus Gracilibacteria bacterium]
MALTESGANAYGELVNDALKKLFGENFETDVGLQEILDVVIHNKKTPAERIFRINNSGLTDNVRVLLSNINGGITLGKFEYHPNNTDYSAMLNLINLARKTLGKAALLQLKNTPDAKAMTILNLA